MIKKIRNLYDYSVIILAAGKSSRMGRPKWSLKFDNKQSFVEHIIYEYNAFGCKQIILVINETDYSSFVEMNFNLPVNFRVVINKHPEWERFYSLKLGVEIIDPGNSVFIHNIDNPFVIPEVLTDLANNLSFAECIVPEYNGCGGHPVLISPDILKTILETNDINVNLKKFLSRFNVKRSKTNDSRILVNINQQSDYLLYFKS